MKIKIQTFLLAAVLAFVLVPFAIGQEPNKAAHGQAHFKEQPKLFHGLKLTEGQRSKVLDSSLKLKKNLLPIQNKLKTKRDELKILKIADNPNLKLIDKKIDEISKVQAELHKIRVRHQLEVRKILTPEQKKIFDNKTLDGHAIKRLHGRPHFMKHQNFW